MNTDPDLFTSYLVEIDAGHDGQRLDRALSELLPDLSRSRLKALILEGMVSTPRETLNNPSGRVKCGMTITVGVPPSEAAEPEPEAIPLDIVYEDEALLVINKPAGMVVHPAAGHARGTLVNALLAHCGDSLSGIGGVARPGIVHRLDKETSGLMVVAKTDAAHRGLSAQFAERRLSRVYHVLVWGHPRPGSGVIEKAIGRHPRDRKRMAVVTRNGKPAITRYTTTEILGPHATALTCVLGTGRTHQIRVHLANMGHPVIGDGTYGGLDRKRVKLLEGPARACVLSLNRLALHAMILKFIHPTLNEKVEFFAEVPLSINELAKTLSERPIHNQ